VFKVETWGPPREIQLVGEGRKLLAGLSTGSIQIVDLERGRGRRRIAAHEGEISRIIALPGASRFASRRRRPDRENLGPRPRKPLAVLQAQSEFRQAARGHSLGRTFGRREGRAGDPGLVAQGKVRVVRLETFREASPRPVVDEAGNWAVMAGIPDGIKLLDVKTGVLIEPEDGATLSASVAAIFAVGNLYAAGPAKGP